MSHAIAILVLLVCPDVQKYPLVHLSDVDRFRVTAQETREFWSVSRRHIEHYEPILLERYKFEDVQRWKCECCTSRDAWDALDNVVRLGENNSLEWKLRELERLRNIIGDDRYYAGVMPMPVPVIEE